MRRTKMIWLLMVATVMMQAVGVSAQDSTDGDGSPMPYTDYRATLERFEAEQPSSEGEGFPTVEETVELMEQIIELGEADQERLRGIVPEPCYVAAHEELMAYRGTALALYEDILPMAAESDSVLGMLPILMGMDAELRARHPEAYVEDSASMSGYANEPMNILDTLVTCGGSTVAAIPEAPTPPPVMAFSEGAVFVDTGSGSKSTAPFELETGDYRLTYQANAGDNLCSFGIGLDSTDDTYSGSIGRNGMYVYQGPPYANETWFHVPQPGRYYLDVSGDCRWSAALEALPSELDDSTTIRLVGSGLGDSMPFALSGGDYVVRYELTSPRSDESCDVSGRLIDPQSPFMSLGGDISLDMAAGSIESGETYVYGVESGRYQFDMNFAWCQFSVSEPVDWVIDIERLE